MPRSDEAERIVQDMIVKRGLSYRDAIAECEMRAAPYLEVACELRGALYGGSVPLERKDGTS